MQIRLRDGLLKDSFAILFQIAGLLGTGGALVFWAALLRDGVHNVDMDMRNPLVYILVLCVSGVLTVLVYMPFRKLMRNWMRHKMTQAGLPSRNKFAEIIKRIKRLWFCSLSLETTTSGSGTKEWFYRCSHW
jgi:hypothetical protein